LLCGLLTLGLVVPHAQAVNCSQLVNPVYVSGSSALEPLYKAIGPTLATDKTMPLTIVYQKPGSCPGISGLTVKQTANPLYIDATFDGINVPTCTNDIVGGFPLDIALSDVSYENCVGSPIPAAYQDFLGPVESMVFAVPRASSQTAITAEEAYYLFGFGMFGNDLRCQVSPDQSNDLPSLQRHPRQRTGWHQAGRMLSGSPICTSR
jgi:hypothetical protein